MYVTEPVSRCVQHYTEHHQVYQQVYSQHPGVSEISPKELRSEGSCFSYDETDSHGKIVTKRFLSRWLKDDNKKTFDEVIFEPMIHTDPRLYNLFDGFIASKLPTVAMDRLSVVLAPYHTLLHSYLAVGDPHAAEYYLKWVSHVLQKPMEPTKIALFFNNGEWVYKQHLVSFIATCVIGSQSALATMSTVYVPLDRYATFYRNKLFLGFHGSYKTGIDKMVTNPTYDYNVRGYASFEKRNFLNIAIIDDTERVGKMERNQNIIVLRGAVYPQHDAHFYATLMDCFQSPEFAAAFYQFHMAYDINGFDPRQGAAELRSSRM